MTSTSRTARCGPACRVVWQGRSQRWLPPMPIYSCLRNIYGGWRYILLEYALPGVTARKAGGVARVLRLTSRAVASGVPGLSRQRRGGHAISVATANGTCAR